VVDAEHPSVRLVPRFIYLAGPMTKPDLITNARLAIEAGDRLINAGFVPYLPQTGLLWELHRPRSYESWMRLDFAWVERCDALVRLPGESPGADREVEHARRIGKPVWEWQDFLIDFVHPRELARSAGEAIVDV
jgi:nucleoside 2-deoxyribosyltransferase